MPTIAELEVEIAALRETLASKEIYDTETIKGVQNLNTVWGLIEVSQLYRTPVSELVSAEDAAEIARLQTRQPLPEGWGEELCSLVRGSAKFQEWLRTLPSRDLPAFGGGSVRVDTSFPWCVRLRWSAHVATNVDVFVYATPPEAGA